MGAKLRRVVAYVDDVDAVAALYNRLFGMEYRMLDIEKLQLRVAIGEHGFEFVQVLSGEEPMNTVVNAGLAVDDVEATRRDLERHGYAPQFSILLKSGRREYSYPDIGGVSLMVYQESGRFDEIAPGEGITPYDPG